MQVTLSNLPIRSEPNDEVGTSRRPNGRAHMSVASLNPSVKDLRRLAELRAAHESSLEAEKVAAQRSEVLEAALADRDERIGHLEAQLVDDDGLDEAVRSLEARIRCRRRI